MKLPKVVAVQEQSPQIIENSNQDDFFIVVKNHRQACLRRYLRRIRKQKLKQKKKQEEKWIEEAERTRNDILNYNMLREEYLWEVLMDDEKCEHNSQTQQSGNEKVSKIEQAIEFVQQLPIWPKKNLFDNQFQAFSYKA